MELRQILYFVRVAELRSFSRASELLGISQPSLSRQVQQLEAEVGRHLLQRNGRGVEPTEAGMRLLDHGRALLAMADRALTDVRDMEGDTVGRIVVGLPSRVALAVAPALVARFRQRFAHATITVAEGLSASLREMLLSERIELALLYDPAPTPQLAFDSLFRESLVLAGSPARAALPQTIEAARLGDYPLVVPSLPNAIRTVLERACRQQGVQLNVVAEVDAVRTIQELVLKGDVYAVLPRSAVRMPDGACLRMARIVRPQILNDLVLATRSKRRGTRLAEATADMLRELDFASAFAVDRQPNRPPSVL